PIENTTRLFTEYPLQYSGTGELTFHKEHVENQRGPEITLSDPLVQGWLRWLAKNGPKNFSFVIHNDWSRTGLDAEGRPYPVMGAYENFKEVINIFSHPDLRDKVTVVFAHTGIARTARGADEAVTLKGLTYYEPGNSNPVTEDRTFNDHVELMDYLKEKVPN